MKKHVFFDHQAQKDLFKTPEIIQTEFNAIISNLETKGKLDYPEAKKLSHNLFEIRIKIHDSYRGFYAYLKSNYIVILHIFKKKSQKTPKKELIIAYQRLKKYD